MKNVVMKGTGVYIPSNKVYNEELDKHWDDTVVYATFADAAACVALELVEEDTQRGIIDREVFLDASYNEYVTYPKCGMSKVALKAIQPNEKRLEWKSFDMDFLSEKME